jgi:hypothetical protein
MAGGTPVGSTEQDVNVEAKLHVPEDRTQTAKRTGSFLTRFKFSLPNGNALREA